MRCPACQSEASGAYCPECGTPLQTRCNACQAELPAGARFCTACGARTRSARANLPWYIAGVALVAMIVVALLPSTRATPSADASLAGTPILDGGAGAVAPPAGDAGSPPPLTGTPRQQADRLFNLIMQNKEDGDTARARFFVPMGIQAYGMAGQLDNDGLFHLSLLQTLGGEGKQARATAEKILATSPRNLLGLIAAAEGAAADGDAQAAKAYYQRFVDAYPAEKGRTLPEYQDHASALPAYLTEARTYLGK